jgi:hypothetical protein
VADQSDAEPLDVVARLLQEAVRRTLFEFDAKARRDDDLSDAREAAWLKLRLEELGDVHRRVEAAEQLLAWLAERFGSDPDGSEGIG